MQPLSTSSGHVPQPDDETTPKPEAAGRKRVVTEGEEDRLRWSGSPSKRSKSTTSEGSRGSSPSKPNILRSLQHPIRNQSLDVAKFPDETKDLVRRVRRFAAGFETVPEDYKTLLEQTYPDDVDLAQNVTYSPDSERANLGMAPGMRDIARICRQAKGCQQRNETEAAWNSHVDGPLMSLIGELSPHRSTIGSTNVTTARLNPRYKPTVAVDHGPLAGKVVDFVFFLEPSEVTESFFGHLPWFPNHGHDFNHTLHGPIANRPIAISVETKREGEGQSTGRAQLDIWVAAHLNRLQDLGSAETELPIVPLLLTQGPVWSLLLARRERDGEIWITTIYERITLGDISMPSGVFKVTSSLLLLMHWAQTVFRVWLERLLISANDEANQNSAI
ncbi:hypothetical protein LTR86_011001 [Recurvomyces mirabilis]|nr:hypothetical protein LTR86_011001 [Recurvomyces mirabilis]